MENKLKNFLEINSFKLVNSDKSDDLDDYFYTYSNNLIKLRFVSDKSFKSIDIASINNENNWYDLALLKGLIYQEENLNLATSIEELITFLNKELNYINLLFDKNNLCETNNALEKLRDKRMKQMFPNL